MCSFHALSAKESYGRLPHTPGQTALSPLSYSELSEFCNTEFGQQCSFSSSCVLYSGELFLQSKSIFLDVLMWVL